MINQSMVAGIRSSKFGEAPTRPVKTTAVHYSTTDTGTMPTDELGQGIADDVGTMVDRAKQVRGGYRVVNNQRQAMLVGHCGDSVKIIDIILRITEGLNINGLGVVINRSSNIGRIRTVDKFNGYPHTLKRMVE